MEKLTIEHLSAYLPYGLTVKHRMGNSSWVLDKENLSFTVDIIKDVQPVLHSLSDFQKDYGLLVEEIRNMHQELYCETIPCWDDFVDDIQSDFQKIPHWLCKLLFKNHIDIFGLIDKGLAINCNELNPDK